MRRSIALALLLVFAMPVVAYPVFAAGETVQAGITDAGNKLCPMSGESVSGTDFVTYNGKRYGLCCPGCDKEFLKDPAKYLANMKKQEQAASQAVPAAEEGHEHHHGMM